MITPREAEALARSIAADYIIACRCESSNDVANAMMMMMSVAGMTTAAHVGTREAVQRMEGTTDFIARQNIVGRTEFSIKVN